MLEIVQAGQQICPYFKILPCKVASTSDPIESKKTLSLAHRNIREYFNTRQQHISSMNGELRVMSGRTPDGMIDALCTWNTMHDYTIFLASCQAESKDNISMLVKGTKFVFLPDYIAAIKATDLWRSTMAGCEISLAMSHFTGATDEKVRCIMVISCTTTAACAIQFFNETYNTPGRVKPNFLNLFFYPIQFESQNREQRSNLVRLHKIFAEQERKLLICGFSDLDTPLALCTGGPKRSGRQLVMSQRVPGSPQSFLYHGIDRKQVDASHVYFRFSALHQEDAKIGLSNLEARLRQVVHPSCHCILFANEHEPLTYPGGWPLTIMTAPAAPLTALEDDIMLNLVRRPNLPTANYTSMAAPHPMTVSPPVAHSVESVARVTVVSPPPFGGPESTSSPTSTALVVHGTPPGPPATRATRKPAKCARTSTEIITDTPMPDVSRTIIVMPPSHSEAITVPDVDMREANARIDTLQRHQKSTKKVLKQVIFGIQANTDNIHDMQHDIKTLTKVSTRMSQQVQVLYGDLNGNPNFNPESDGEFSL